MEFPKGQVVITHMRPEFAQDACDTVRLAFGVTLDEPCDECMTPKNIYSQLERFPEGQFAAVMQEDDKLAVAGVAVTMRTTYPPTAPPRDWMHAIGTKGIEKHDPNGDWLYGVEMAVRPNYRRRGIGTKLYQARFELVKRLNLKGWYAVGMLMGYHRYRDTMSIRDYGEKVMKREINDPTVTLQMNVGFEAWTVVEDYLDEPDAGDGGVLIVWKNPEYREE